MPTSRSPRAPRSTRSERSHDDLGVLLSAVITLVLASGFPAQRARRIFRERLAVRGSSGHTALRMREVIAVFSRALYVWHNDPRFLDESARPRALSMRGPGDSITELLRSVAPASAVARLTREMLSRGLLIPASRETWLPVGPVATFAGLEAGLTAHGAQAVLRLFSTIRHNAAIRDPQRRLIERAAFVEDLPRRDVAAFRDFVATQGAIFNANVDKWLEDHALHSRNRGRASSARHRGVCAGAHVFAFVQED